MRADGWLEEEMEHLMEWQWREAMDGFALMPILAGALGALTADLTRDNALAAPRIRKGKLYLGSLGTICLGAIAGGIASMTTPASLAALAAGFCARRWLPCLMAQIVFPPDGRIGGPQGGRSPVPRGSARPKEKEA
jgi:hypothetical protein